MCDYCMVIEHIGDSIDSILLDDIPSGNDQQFVIENGQFIVKLSIEHGDFQ